MGHVHITRYLVLKAMVDPEIANFANLSGVELARQMGLLHLLEEAQPNHRICTPEADKVKSFLVAKYSTHMQHSPSSHNQKGPPIRN
jgi:hypothetical protein